DGDLQHAAGARLLGVGRPAEDRGAGGSGGAERGGSDEKVAAGRHRRGGALPHGSVLHWSPWAAGGPATSLRSVSRRRSISSTRGGGRRPGAWGARLTA